MTSNAAVTRIESTVKLSGGSKVRLLFREPDSLGHKFFITVIEGLGNEISLHAMASFDEQQWQEFVSHIYMT